MSTNKRILEEQLDDLTNPKPWDNQEPYLLARYCKKMQNAPKMNTRRTVTRKKSSQPSGLKPPNLDILFQHLGEAPITHGEYKKSNQAILGYVLLQLLVVLWIFWAYSG